MRPMPNPKSMQNIGRPRTRTNMPVNTAEKMSKVLPGRTPPTVELGPIDQSLTTQLCTAFAMAIPNSAVPRASQER